jgi:Zn-dependent peptidase ImmA (M78 family)
MSRFMVHKPYVNPIIVANETLTRCGQPRLTNGRAIDVEHIAQEFCKLELMFIPDLSPSGKPLLGLFTPALNAIMVNSDSIPARQRFTIAHEIGHVQLEYGHGSASPLFSLDEPELFECTEEDEGFGLMDERRAGLRRKKEIRANKFAAHLLMPEGLVREVWREQYGNAERVSNALMVSNEALGYRLKDLGLS